MKKFISIILSFVSVVCIAFAFTGCGKSGEFYSLQDAYDNGFLTVEDLKTIADIYNGEASCTQQLDSKTEKLIIKDIVDYVRNERGVEEADINGIEIVKFYGEYSGCYIITYDGVYWGYPAIIVDEWFYVADIAFHRTNYLGITVWKKL